MSTAEEHLTRLTELRDQIAAAEAREATLRGEQRGQLEVALGAGANVAEVIEAAGLSRAYLHRIGVPLYTPEITRARDLRKAGGAVDHDARRGALEAAQELRGTIEQLRADTEAQREERGELIVKAVRTGTARADVVAASGVSSESVRLRLRRAEQ